MMVILYNRKLWKYVRVIIHNKIKRNNMNFIIENEELNKNNSEKAILFCNPNGVFIQYFGMDN